MTEDLFAMFQEELRDLLESLERGLLDLKSAPTDMDVVNQVFRDLHTIKGNGGMFGYVELAAFIHKFETGFDRIRSGKAVVTPEIIRLSLAARDQIPGLAEGLPDPDGTREAILQALAAAMGETPKAAPQAAAVGATGADVAPAEMPAPDGLLPFQFRLTGESLALGARPDLILKELAELGVTDVQAVIDDVPTLDLLDPGYCDLRWTARVPAAVTNDQIEDVFMFADAVWTVDRSGEALALPVITLDLPPLAAPTAAANVPAEPAPQPKAEAAPALRVVEADPVVEAPAPAAAPRGTDDDKSQAARASQATVRVPADRLDALMDSVGELVIVEARLTELARLSRDPALIGTAELITRLAAGLRDATMTLRMVPMKSLVGRFRRLVSETADKLGKNVRFSVIGEETELDKTLIEKLADPIVHILRNALDHGLETTDERTGTTKEAEGLIELSAQHAGAEVLIRIRDDGRGMNPEKLRAKAVSQGLISADAVMTDSQLFALVFEPGFSTAAQVTELSGRGVGMDVVRRTIESLRGTIEIDSKLGVGTTITLRMPLTLAIIEGLLIEVAGERYTLPLANVHEIVELPEDKSAPNRAGDFLDIRGRFVPFLRLRSLFECTGAPAEDQNVVIVMSGDTRVGLVVDRIIGTNQTVIKQMSKLHSDLRAVSGATILGDGSVALILDVAHLVGMSRAHTENTPLLREVAA